MDVIVADPSILSALERVRHIERYFYLPAKFKMRDLLHLSVLAAPEEGWVPGKKLLRLGLEVEELNGNQMRNALDYYHRFRQLFLPASYAIARCGYGQDSLDRR